MGGGAEQRMSFSLVFQSWPRPSLEGVTSCVGRQCSGGSPTSASAGAASLRLLRRVYFRAGCAAEELEKHWSG